MVKVEIPILSSATHLWMVLFEETNEWWGASNLTSKYSKKMVFQEYVGGKLYEDFGNREGLIWAEVIGIKSPLFAELKGHLSPQFGGPNISFSTIKLEPKENHTVLVYEETWMISQEQKFYDNLTKGWHQIFMNLKLYVEHPDF